MSKKIEPTGAKEVSRYLASRLEFNWGQMSKKQRGLFGSLAKELQKEYLIARRPPDSRDGKTTKIGNEEGNLHFVERDDGVCV